MTYFQNWICRNHCITYNSSVSVLHTQTKWKAINSPHNKINQPQTKGKSTFIKRFMETLVIPNIENVSATKKGNSEGAMGSKSKMNLMKSYKNIKKEAAPKKNKLGE